MARTTAKGDSTVSAVTRVGAGGFAFGATTTPGAGFSVDPVPVSSTMSSTNCLSAVGSETDTQPTVATGIGTSFGQCAPLQLSESNASKKDISPIGSQPKLVQSKATKPKIGATFESKAGSWKCRSCMVQNDANSTKCAACAALQSGNIPGDSTGVSTTPVVPGFINPVPITSLVAPDAGGSPATAADSSGANTGGTSIEENVDGATNDVRVVFDDDAMSFIEVPK